MADENDAIKQASDEQARNNKQATKEAEEDVSKFREFVNFAIGSIGAAVVLGTEKGREQIEKAYMSGVVQTGQYSDKEMFALSDVMKTMTKDGFSFKLVINALLAVAEQVTDQLHMEAELRRAINEETGMTGKLSEMVQENIWDAYPAILNLGYGVEQITKYYTDLVAKTGKFTQLNEQSLVRSAEVARAFVGDLSQMSEVLSNFEKVGIGATTALETINDVGVESLVLGLRSKKTIEDIGNNIERINQYGFSNGIEGLAEMSRKATEFRMNMEDTFTIAEKVISPEGAIDLAANLQVIGGTIGDFADPLKMMYMATNNVEGLQDALIGAAGSLATYNSEQGRFEVTGANLRRARDMAEAMGVSLGDLTRTAIASSERVKAAQDLLSTGLKMTDEDREFLMNLGTMKDGVMTIQVPESIAESLSLPTEIAVSDMTEGLKKTLLENKKAFEKMDAIDIAQAQLTEITKMERNIGSMAAMARIQASKMIKETDAFRMGDAVMSQGNKELMNAWSGGKFEEFVKGGFELGSGEGETFMAKLKNEFGKSQEAMLKFMNAAREQYQTEKKSAEQAQNTTQTVQGNVHVTVSNANNSEALVRETLKNPQVQGLTTSKRSFVYYFDE